MQETKSKISQADRALVQGGSGYTTVWWRLKANKWGIRDCHRDHSFKENSTSRSQEDCHCLTSEDPCLRTWSHYRTGQEAESTMASTHLLLPLTHAYMELPDHNLRLGSQLPELGNVSSHLSSLCGEDFPVSSHTGKKWVWVLKGHFHITHHPSHPHYQEWCWSWGGAQLFCSEWFY